MVVCSTSTQSAGCTFLDWSIHFLTGQTEFFNVMRGWIPLSSNPITKINAHGHEKNHPAGLVETHIAVQKLHKSTRLTSVYPLPAQLDRVAQKLGIDINTALPDQWQTIFDYQTADYNQMLQMCNENNVKVIFVSIPDHLSVYANTVRSLDRMPFSNQPAQSTQDLRDSLDRVFFKDSVAKWDQIRLSEIWDLRERYALNKNLISWKQPVVELNFNHYWVDTQNLWYNGEREIQKIIQWLKLDIDVSRLESWQAVYSEWQQLQLDTLQFQYNYKHIVESIVNNWSYSIDLSFEQEVVIQHCLIFEYGLNLKTWQLEKFPNNTQELHKLLETNIHAL